MQLAGLDTAKVERGPTATVDGIDPRTANLDLADPDVAVTGKESERRPSGQRATTQRAGHDGAAALDREDPVDREGRRARGRLDVRPKRDQRSSYLVEPVPGDARRGKDRGAREGGAGQQRLGRAP